MIIVDTSVWIDFFADRATLQAKYLRDTLVENTDEVGLTDIILTEVLQGLRDDRSVQRVEEHLSVFPILRLRDLSDFRHAAALYRSARRRGVTIRRTSDCLIAAVCIREATPLLHADADFDRLSTVTDLAVVNAG